MGDTFLLNQKLNMEDKMMNRGLTKEIAALNRHYPAHSVSPVLLQIIDELEIELQLVRKKVIEEGEDAQ